MSNIALYDRLLDSHYENQMTLCELAVEIMRDQDAEILALSAELLRTQKQLHKAEEQWI